MFLRLFFSIHSLPRDSFVHLKKKSSSVVCWLICCLPRFPPSSEKNKIAVVGCCCCCCCCIGFYIDRAKRPPPGAAAAAVSFFFISILPSANRQHTANSFTIRDIILISWVIYYNRRASAVVLCAVFSPSFSFSYADLTLGQHIFFMFTPDYMECWNKKEKRIYIHYIYCIYIFVCVWKRENKPGGVGHLKSFWGPLYTYTRSDTFSYSMCL